MTVQNLFIFILGFLSQVLFFARAIVQWLLSEKAGKILSPLLFWEISLLASIMMLVYGILRSDLAIIFGQVLVYFIYIRNIQMQKAWKKFSPLSRIFILALPFLCLIAMIFLRKNSFNELLGSQQISGWLLVWGLVSQLVFTFRFFYQWLFSEKRKESHLPIGFWYISMVGSLMIIFYAFKRHDPVLLFGHIGSMIMYIRNIMLHFTGRGLLDWLPVEKRSMFEKKRFYFNALKNKYMKKNKNHLSCTILLFVLISALNPVMIQAQDDTAYLSLDQKDPVFFDGKQITYGGKRFILNEKCFFVDGQLSKQQAEKSPFVFNTLNEALDQIQDGTPETPMTILLAPYVYWTDDPDDQAVRKPLAGGIPFARMVKCNWLKLLGLTTNPQNVVVACNRGQTMGAVGNFTMFFFDGDGISLENLTFGNYCNVDLRFPLKPELNRNRRAEAIVQAQLAICNSDKVLALNCHFISRLNSCPMVGAKRALFQNCYFECTDDALCGTGVYHQCRFTFFSSKPFYSTHGTGAVFLDCDINVLSRDQQYCVKVGTPVTLIDCRFSHETDSLFLGWTPKPSNTLRCYQHQVTLNGKQVYLQPDYPKSTILLDDKEASKSYRIVKDGKVIYNLFNLLRGDDQWNPTNMDVLTPHLPTRIFCTPQVSVESGISEAIISADVFCFYNIKSEKKISWSVDADDQKFIRLEPQADGSCKVIGLNEQDETKTVIVTARTISGLEAACEVTVKPKQLEAPLFLVSPKLKYHDHQLELQYQLDLQGRADQSVITWYRCSDAIGNQAIEVATSRLNQPERVWLVSPEDVGYYLMATIQPKHLRCLPGKEERVVSEIITADMATERPFETDFRNFPTGYQPEIRPGFWTVDCYKPKDTNEFDWQATSGQPSWFYGQGSDNARGFGLIQATKGARLLYTPLEKSYGDMSLALEVSPFKSAGQGFGSATGQYLDIGIKFDTRTLTGYVLRIIRTTKYDHAVDFMLMKYKNGTAHAISDPVSSTCYLTKCSIVLKTVGNKLFASAQTTAKQGENQSKLPHQVELEANIEPNAFGGLAIQHTGSTGSGATMLNKISVNWW